MDRIEKIECTNFLKEANGPLFVPFLPILQHIWKNDNLIETNKPLKLMCLIVIRKINATNILLCFKILEIDLLQSAETSN